MPKTVPVSVIIPCRNEEAYIGACLDSLLQQDFGLENMEVFVVDGLSTDATRERVAKYQIQHTNIHLLNNEPQTVPYALNKGIEQSQGHFIVRIDVHCIYPPDYISQLLHWQQQLSADNVGAVIDTVPGNQTVQARAIATACSHPLGVGNSLFRTGTTEVKEVDTVPFGCYQREVFNRIGLFDEELTRNQDDEFNARLIRNGGKIFLIPSIVVRYFARTTLGHLWTMYYQYGLFKPLVAKKLGKPATLRQLAPLILVLGLIAGLLLGFLFGKWFWLVFVGSLFGYMAIVFAVSAQLAFGMTAQESGSNELSLWAYLSAAFTCLHFAYGIGYLRGLLRLLLPGKPGASRSAVKLSR